MALETVDEYVWSGGQDKFVCVWRAVDLKQVARFKAGNHPLTTIKVVFFPRFVVAFCCCFFGLLLLYLGDRWMLSVLGV